MAKRKNIAIGHVASTGRRFVAPEALVTETSAVLGRRGSGKTHTAVVCAEGLLKKPRQQVVILDPLDVWWGLKSSKDGDSKGFDILLLGDARKPHTDLPLAEHDAQTIADFIVDEGMSCILSMRHLAKAARKRFAARFAERIYERKGDPGRNTPTLFIVDEAGTFVPQRVMGEDAAMVGAFESWVRQGRSSGIGVMLIDQRPATVNKEVLTQVELLIAHQLTGPHDKKAVREWVDEKADDGDAAKVFFDSLPKLPRGEAWFWSPSWLQCFDRVNVADRKTFDSSATPTAGKSIAPPKTMADIDLDALKGKLNQAIERKKDNDPALLKKRIAELERERVQYTKANAEMGSRLTELEVQLRERPAETQRVEVPAVKDADIKRIEKASAELQKSLERAVKTVKSGKVDAAMHRIDAVAENLRSVKEQCHVGSQSTNRINVRTRDQRRESDRGETGAGHTAANSPRSGTAGQRDRVVHADRSGEIARGRTHRSDAENHTGELDGPSRRILNGLAWWQAIGIDSPTMAQLGFAAGYKPKGGSFNTYVSRLSTSGMLERGGGRVSLTDEGQALAAIPETPPTIDELHGRIFDRLDGPQHKIMNVVIDAGIGAALSRDDIAEATGYQAKGGSFNTYLSRLSTLGLIERDRGSIKATNVIWPEGLA